MIHFDNGRRRIVTAAGMVARALCCPQRSLEKTRRCLVEGKILSGRSKF